MGRIWKLIEPPKNFFDRYDAFRCQMPQPHGKELIGDFDTLIAAPL
jgi:hypothetical protein